MTAGVLTPDRRATLNRRSLQLAYATAGYNMVEGIVAVAAGPAASSAALLGFGLDSDPIAALVIAGVAIREGVEAWRGEQCEDCATPSRQPKRLMRPGAVASPRA